MADLYTNENFPLPAAKELQRLGHDVMTVQESGLGDAHAGIIVCTLDRDFTGLARRVAEAIRDGGHLAGKLIRVNREP